MSISTSRRNFSLVTRYSLKLTRCSLLLVKSLVTRCKIRSLLVAKNHSLLVAEVARCKKSLVTRCKIRSLLVAEVARCKNSLVTRCRIRSLQKSLVTRYETNPRTNVYLKSIKSGEFYLFIFYFQLTKNRERFRTQ